MKKIICYMLIGLMLLSMAGCVAEEPVAEVVAPELEEVAEEAEEPELIVGQETAEGLVPSGIIGLFLNGDDAEERLRSLAVPLQSLAQECFDKGFLSNWDVMGVGETETGSVMNIKIIGDGANITAFIEGVQEVTKAAGFNEGESWIECDMAKPPFLYSEDVMRNMFANSINTDMACLLSRANIDGVGVILPDDVTNSIVKRNSYKYGYPVSESTVSAEDYRRSRVDTDAVIFLYPAIEAMTSPKTEVPAFLCLINTNVGCEISSNYLTRNSETLSQIFGNDLLDKIYELGCAKAKSVLDLGTEHILQSNRAMVYTDANGDFRVRLSLMVKDPAGKTGWFVTAYEVIVNPVEGDMFTCAEYEATGEIIQLIPYISFETSMECGRSRFWKEDGKQYSFDEGECGLTPMEIAHAFYAAGKGKELVELWPDALHEHYTTCEWDMCEEDGGLDLLYETYRDETTAAELGITLEELYRYKEQN